jgi:poly(beta-D-mannuronate) lyase
LKNEDMLNGERIHSESRGGFFVKKYWKHGKLLSIVLTLTLLFQGYPDAVKAHSNASISDFASVWIHNVSNLYHENASIGKNVTVNGVFENDYQSEYAPEKAVDGNLDTAWMPTAYRAWYSPTEMRDVESYINVDLGTNYLVDQVNIKELGNHIVNYTVRYSTDNATWMNLATTKAASDSGTLIQSGLSQPIVFRYVRLDIQKASGLPGIAEIEVSGKEATRFARNIASGKAKETSSDGRALTVDLGRAVEFDQIAIQEKGGKIGAYTISYSNDKLTWNVFAIGDRTGLAGATIVKADASVIGRYVKLDVAANDTPSIDAFEVYGKYANLDGVPNQTYMIGVGDLEGLHTAMRDAIPGDTIVMKNGEWVNAAIRFSADATAARPVTLRAETPGQVILKGNSSISINSPYLVVDGMYFKGDPATITPNSNDKLVSMNSDYGRLTNSYIDHYNPVSPSTGSVWVYLNGSYNRIDRNRFEGKNNSRPLIQQDKFGRRYNQIDHNYFYDIPKTDGANGREMIQLVGYGSSEELGNDGSYALVENNLFYKADGETQETISVKSNRNIIRNNTFVETKGGPTFRSGNFNTFQGNFIFGNHVEGTDGFRASGKYHTIVDNYIADVERFGISLTIGDFIEEHLTDSFKPALRTGTPLGRYPNYSQVKYGSISNNTIINTGRPGLWTWWKYKSGWAGAQRVAMPEDNMITNNIMTKTYISDKPTTPEEIAASPYAVYFHEVDTAPPLDRISGQLQSNTFAGNFAYADYDSNSPVFFNGADAAAGFAKEDPMLVKGSDGLYRPASNGPAAQAGANLRDRLPLTAADVGPSWIKDDDGGNDSDIPTLSAVGNSEVTEGHTLNMNLGMHNRMEELRAQMVTVTYDVYSFEIDPASIATVHDGTSILGVDSKPGVLKLILVHLSPAVGSPAELIRIPFIAKIGTANNDQDAEISIRSEAGLSDGSELQIDTIRFPVRIVQESAGYRTLGSLARMVPYYGARVGDPDWDRAKFADINRDGVVDIEDFIIVARNILE